MDDTAVLRAWSSNGNNTDFNLPSFNIISLLHGDGDTCATNESHYGRTERVEKFPVL
jgi:hypothetical protein